jgi:hypothetical protein
MSTTAETKCWPVGVAAGTGTAVVTADVAPGARTLTIREPSSVPAPGVSSLEER